MNRVMGICVLFLAVVFGFNTEAFAGKKAASQSKIFPEVYIVYPESPFATSSSKIDVTVHFKATTGNCKVIQLIIGGKVIATYSNSASKKEGDHTFTNVNIGSILNEGASLSAVAYQGNTNNPNSGSDPEAEGSAIIVQYDTISPVLTLASPLNNTILKNAKPVIKATMSDNLSGIDTTSVVLKLDGKAVAATVTETEVTYTPAENLTDGTHTVTLNAKDKAGNAAKEILWTFMTDVTNPVISEINPLNEAYVNNNKPVISAALNDLTSGIDTETAKLYINNIKQAVVLKDGVLSFVPVVALVDGEYTVKFTVADKAGNIATATSKFYIDTVKPEITDILPLTNSFINILNPIITGKVTDDFSGIDNALTKLLINNIEQQIEINKDGVITLKEQTAFAEGLYTLTINTKDNAGNSNTSSVIFTIDITKPEIISLTPTANTTIDTPKPVISAAIKDILSGLNLKSFTMTLNTQEIKTAEFKDGKLTYTSAADLADGDYTVVVTAKDKAGNKAESTWSFKILTDQDPPEISDETPANNDKTSGLKPTISAKYTDAKSGVDATSVKLLVDGTDVTASATITAAKITYTPAADLSNGIHEVTLSVTDKNNNTATANWTFEVIYAPLVGNDQGEIFDYNFDLGGKGTVVELFGKYLRPDTKVSIGGVECEVIYKNSEKIYVKVPTLPNAPTAGADPVSYDVTVDNGLDTAKTTADSFKALSSFVLEVSDLNEDEVFATNEDIELSGSIKGGLKPYTVTAAIHSGNNPVINVQLHTGADTTSSLSKTLNLYEGMNQIIISAKDSAGNIAVKRYWANKDTTAPNKPTSVSVYNSDNENGSELIVTWKSDYTADEFTIIVKDEAGNTVNTFNEIKNEKTFNFKTITGLTNGTKYTANIKATDAAGNESEEVASASIMAKPFANLHDIKKKIEEKRVSLGMGAYSLWSNCFSTINPELSQVRSAVGQFNNQTYIDGGVKLQTWQGYDVYGLGGSWDPESPAWDSIPVPGDQGWEDLSGTGYITESAKTQLNKMIGKLSSWITASCEVEYIKNWGAPMGGNFGSSIGELYSKDIEEYDLQLSWGAIYEESDHWVGSYCSGFFYFVLAFGSNDYCSTCGYGNRKCEIKLYFPSSSMYEKYYWTMSGNMDPDTYITEAFDYGTPVMPADPYGKSEACWDGVYSSYAWSNYTQISKVIYGKCKPRTLTKEKVIITPTKRYVQTGDKAQFSATVVYKSSGWGAGNGKRDPWESYTDKNNNGKYDRPESFSDSLNGEYDEGESFDDNNNNGKWDEGENFTDAGNGNGKWDAGEGLVDIDGDGQWTPSPDSFQDTGKKNNTYDLGEKFTDEGNEKWDSGELFHDHQTDTWIRFEDNTRKYDEGESFVDEGNGVWDTGETFVDEDAVFTYIPTPIKCENSDAIVTNTGGSKVIPTKPGTYKIETKLGGEAKLYVADIDIVVTDTQGNIIGEIDEEKFGALLPCFSLTKEGDPARVYTSGSAAKVKFNITLPEGYNEDSTYPTIAIPTGINLFKGNPSFDTLIYGKALAYKRDENGNIIYTQVQKLDADGNPVFNAQGDPVMINGDPEYEEKFINKLVDDDGNKVYTVKDLNDGEWTLEAYKAAKGTVSASIDVGNTVFGDGCLVEGVEFKVRFANAYTKGSIQAVNCYIDKKNSIIYVPWDEYMINGHGGKRVTWFGLIRGLRQKPKIWGIVDSGSLKPNSIANKGGIGAWHVNAEKKLGVDIWSVNKFEELAIYKINKKENFTISMKPWSKHKGRTKTSYNKKTFKVIVVDRKTIIAAYGADFQNSSKIDMVNYLSDYRNGFKGEDLNKTFDFTVYSKNIKEKFYRVCVVVEEKEFLKGLSIPGSYVVFDGHSNYGIGPAFGKGYTKISQFTNLGSSSTAPSFNSDDGLREHHPSLLKELNGYFRESALSKNVKNYKVSVGNKYLVRFPNDRGAGIQTSVKVGESFPTPALIDSGGYKKVKFHYIINGGYRSLVNSGERDKPTLKYNTFFFNSCYSGLYFFNQFKHGRLIYTQDLVGTQVSTLFVKGIIEGKKWQNLVDEMNKHEREENDDNDDDNDLNKEFYKYYENSN